MNLLKHLLAVLIVFSFTCHAADSTFMDYQNFNHGYCPECTCYPCKCDGAPPPGPPLPPAQPAPGVVPLQPGSGMATNAPPVNTCPKPDPCNPAPVCGAQCGIPIWVLGGVIATVATAAAIIIGSNNGHAHGSS